HRGATDPVRWCPAPPVRAQQLRDLVRWNDRPGRTGADVEALLGSVERAALREVDRGRGQLAAFSGREWPVAGPGSRRMQAIQVHHYGGPEQLEWAEAPDPHAGPGQIRIAVRAASVNPL